MLTPKQEEWVNHLSDTNHVEIFPFDPTSEEKFKKVKEQIQTVLGKSVEILHRGASSLGISGQREIDVYIPILPEKIEEYTLEMEKVFGKPKSIYPSERTKFLEKIDGTIIEIMLTNKYHESWINGETFYSYLKENNGSLNEYRILKENGEGLSNREYYRRKIEFINSVLNKN